MRFQRELRELAQVLRVDHVEAACEYRSVVPLVLELTSTGQPLATAPNAQAWASALRPEVRLSHLPQRAAMTSLNAIMRRRA